MKIRNTFLISLLMLMACGWANKATAHNELVATFLVDSYEGQVFVKAIVEKRHLTMALKEEGDCQAAEMMSKCGSAYILDHLTLRINGEVVDLSKMTMDIEQDNVVFLFQAEGNYEEVNKVDLESDYMFDYNDHAILRAVIGISEQPKIYTLRPGFSQLHYRAS